MLRWSLAFLIVALIAAVLGFTPVAGASYETARILFFVFLIPLVVTLLFDNWAPRNIV